MITSIHRRLAFAVLIGGVLLFVACTSWDDPNLTFPENYADSYHKLHKCQYGAHPAGEYIITWINDAGKATWDKHTKSFDKATYPWPVGTVFLKAQYEDNNCETISRYTVMYKDVTGTAADTGNWRWQHVGPSGKLNEDGQLQGCISCHAPYKECDYVATGCKKK